MLGDRMTSARQDQWAEWLLDRRFGGDASYKKVQFADGLLPLRDKLLTHAALADGDTLLDVGCGDGFIAFGALARVNLGKAIFSDISDDLLKVVAAHASELNVLDRCEFLRASAEDLSQVPDGSVDVVSVRSVVIYVSDKQRAFDEFYRVLKPGGRLSMFEPISRYGRPEPPHLFNGFNVAPVAALADKVKAVLLRAQPPDVDPMFNFDERDLLVHAERAGFTEVHLDLDVAIKPFPAERPAWEVLLRTAANPRVPTLGEAMATALTPDEAEAFTAHFRPLFETGQGTARTARSYLWAVKHS